MQDGRNCAHLAVLLDKERDNESWMEYVLQFGVSE